MPSSPASRKKSGKRPKSTAGKESPKSTVITIQVQKPNDTVDPVVVSFPGGVPEYHRNNKPKFMLRKLTPSTKHGRLLKGQDADGTCQYMASCQGMAYDDRKTKVCVGVLDKTTNTLTLHQGASKGTVYTLQQGVSEYQETGLVDHSDMTTSALLYEDFGSAKKRKVLRSQKANKVDVTTTLGAGEANAQQLKGNMSASNQQAVASTGTVLEPVAAAHDEARRAMLPPFDANATEAWEVYKPQAMVGDPEAWGLICRVVTACIHQSEIAEAFWQKPKKEEEEGKEARPEKTPEQRGWAPSVMALFRFLEDAYRKVSEPEQTKTLEKQFQCALLLHHLYSFYSQFFRGFGRVRSVGGIVDEKPRWFGTPKPIAQQFLESMATEQMQRPRQQPLVLPDDDDKKKKETKKDDRPRIDLSDIPKYVMTKANQDKCLVSMFLVYIMAKGGPSMVASDLSPLIDDLKGVDTKTAVNLLRQAGCTVKSTPAKKRLQASLTVPLTFPNVQRGGAKRKR